MAMPASPAKHFFADPPVNTPEICVSGIGIRERMRPRPVNRSNGRSDWLFMFFYDQVHIGTSTDCPPYPPLHLMIWPPHAHQFYGTTHTEWSHSWMHCEGKFIQRMVRRLRLPLATPLPNSEPTVTERHLLAILEELTGPTHPDEKIICNLIENWLRHVKRALTPHDQPHIPERFRQAERYLQMHYDQSLRLDELAHELHLSVPHVCSEFKRYFGVSPMQYAIRLRLHHAAYLLADRNLTITQIAQQVGYDDLYHFSKLFKKHMGQSPSAMRGD